MSPTSTLHSLADQAAHGVDDAGAGCTIHTATQGQEKPSLEGANQVLCEPSCRGALPHPISSLAPPCEPQSPTGAHGPAPSLGVAGEGGKRPTCMTGFLKGRDATGSQAAFLALDERTSGDLRVPLPFNSSIDHHTASKWASPIWPLAS